MDKESKKYLICPICFSLYVLDSPQEDDTLYCDVCEDIEVLSLEDFLYYSSSENLKELQCEFSRSKHLDQDLKDFIINNISILIELLEEL